VLATAAPAPPPSVIFSGRVTRHNGLLLLLRGRQTPTQRRNR